MELFLDKDRIGEFIKLPLFEGEDALVNDLHHIIEQDYKVYSDKEYNIYLNIDSKYANQRFSDFEFWINDEKINSHIDSQYTINFDNQCIFKNCYGLIVITISFLIDNKEFKFVSPYISVLVKQTEENENIKKMVSYISSYQNYLLNVADINDRTLMSIENASLKTIESKIEVATNLLRMYESQYGYFKANHRYKIENKSAIIPFEKLHAVDSDTINFIVSHPDELRKVNTDKGIQIGGSNYHPNRVLSKVNYYSEDIYENQVIVSFLYKLMFDLDELIRIEKKIIRDIPSKMESDDYYYSTYFIYELYLSQHKEYLKEIVYIRSRFETIAAMYESIMIVSRIDIPLSGPIPTAIFMTEPVYNQIFIEIHKWFNFGAAEYKEENLYFTFSNISYLYENYVLLKLISAIKKFGYNLTKIEHFEYKVDTRRLFKNTKLNNTFYFSNGSLKVILYYQPFIEDGNSKVQNGIELYRNNSTNLDSIYRGKYYAPDYLIKVEDDNKIAYHVLDAKYSSFNNTRLQYFPILVYKYLFSMSCHKEGDYIAGLTLLYGKDDNIERSENFYDLQPKNLTIFPYARIISLSGIKFGVTDIFK